MWNIEITPKDIERVLDIYDDEIPMPEVVFANGHILAVNKPSYLPRKRKMPIEPSIVVRILKYLMVHKDFDPKKNDTFPLICTAAPENVSGLVFASLDEKGETILKDTLCSSLAIEEFIAIVRGEMGAAHVKGYIKKNEKTHMVSFFEDEREGSDFTEVCFTPLCKGENTTLLNVRLIKGATGHCFTHLALAGHPVIGDPAYGNAIINRKYRLAYGAETPLLHSFQTTLQTGEGEIICQAPLPWYFGTCMEGEKLHM